MTSLIDPDLNKALVIAHPDDEVLWAGGLLNKYRKNWTIICCSVPREDPIRTNKFARVCDRLGIPFRIYDHREYLDTLFDHLNTITLHGFDLILTHNKVGEYGHPHHIAVHEHFTKTFHGRIYCFGYGLPREQAVCGIDLSQSEWEQKQSLIKMYDHTPVGHGLSLGEGLLAKYVGQFDLRREYFLNASPDHR